MTRDKNSFLEVTIEIGLVSIPSFLLCLQINPAVWGLVGEHYLSIFKILILVIDQGAAELLPIST